MKHGDYGSAEYMVWGGMIQRCNNPKTSNYQYYGGRGVKVCKRWNLYENFLADMGRKPSPKHTIDRIDNSGDYEPSNCKWATPKEQCSNRRPQREHKLRAGSKTGHKEINLVAGKFRVRIYDRGNKGRRHIGYYNTLEEALIAREAAR